MLAWHFGQVVEIKREHKTEIEGMLLAGEAQYVALIEAQRRAEAYTRVALEKRNEAVRVEIKEIVKEIEKPILRNIEVPANCNCPVVSKPVDDRLRLLTDRLNGLMEKAERANDRAAGETATK